MPTFTQADARSRRIASIINTSSTDHLMRIIVIVLLVYYSSNEQAIYQ
jgi:hypothetical protein